MISYKPKVATSYRDLSRKINLITKVMRGYPEGMTPKMIALKTRLNVNTIKSLLPKMAGVEKIMRGLYKVSNGGDSPNSVVVDLFDWNFHNLILTADVPDCPVCRHEVFDFSLVKCDLLVNRVKATFRVSSDFPLNVSSICFVSGFFSHLVGIPSSSVMVSTIEFNRDYRNLRLDGVGSVAVDSLVEQFKVYQKKKGMRVEHKTKVPMSVTNIVDMLKNNPNSLEFNVKLNDQAEKLDRLTKATEVTTQLLYKLIDRGIKV